MTKSTTTAGNHFAAKASAIRAAKREGHTLDTICLHFDGEENKHYWTPAKVTQKAKTATKDLNEGIRRVSEIDGPCALVWQIAENLNGATRGRVINACVEAGVATNTARTQYQKWSVASRNSK